MGELLPRDGDLEVEVAARVGDEAAGHEGAAHEGAPAAVVLDEVACHARSEAAAREQDAEALEVGLELVLLGHLDEVVPRLVQVGVAHGERRLEVEQLVGELDHGSRNRAGLGGDAHRVAARSVEGEGAADARDGGELRVGAQLAVALDARELVFYLGREGHVTSQTRRGAGCGARASRGSPAW